MGQHVLGTEHTKAVNKRVKYTKDEIDLIIANVKKYPDNLLESFRQSAKTLDKEVNSISSKYYSCIKKKHNMLSVGTSSGFSKNNTKVRHNMSDQQETPLHPQLNHFHKVVIEILQLTPEEIIKLRIILDQLS